MKTFVCFFVTLVTAILSGSAAQAQSLIQGTLKAGAKYGEVEIWVKPNFNFLASYICQYKFPIAFPATTSPQPTGISFVLDSAFSAVEEQDGSSYSVTVSPKAHNNGNTINYFTIELIRTGITPYNRPANTEYKVGTFIFQSPGGVSPALEKIKLADFQDGGSDFNGNFYTVDGFGNYYVTPNSMGNFYAFPFNSVTGGDPFEGYAETISATSLPVNLLASTARKAGANRSLISWVITSEKDMRYFEVERSLSGVKNSYQVMGVPTPAIGNSTSVASYEVYDDHPAIGANYYRLKMVDVSGKATFSDTRIVHFGSQEAGESVTLFPNPVRAGDAGVNLKVAVLTAQTLYYTLTDITGRFLLDGKIEASTDRSTYRIAGFESMLPGTYFLQVKGTTLSESIKVLKMN